MGNAYFDCVTESGDGGSYRAGPHTAGPWDPRLQHGGPPSALLVRAAERLAVASGRDDVVALRYAAEFVGPVPVGDLAVGARLVRAARSGVLAEVELTAAGRSCLQARVWLVRDADTGSVAHPTRTRPVPDDLPGLGMSFPYADTVEWRAERGSMATIGPAAMWARPLVDVIDGENPTGLQRTVLVGDSASGISRELDVTRWSFLNIDLDVHLVRPLDGDWVHVDAVTQLGAHGSGLTRSTVSDVAGLVGCTAQTLVLAPRRPADLEGSA